VSFASKGTLKNVKLADQKTIRKYRLYIADCIAVRHIRLNYTVTKLMVYRSINIHMLLRTVISKTLKFSHQRCFMSCNHRTAERTPCIRESCFKSASRFTWTLHLEQQMTYSCHSSTTRLHK